MISRNNLSQSRWNRTQKEEKSRCNFCKSTGLIPSEQQLSLFVDPPTEEVDLPPYPLQIGYIPGNQRITPLKFCKLVHYESGLNIPGQFTYDEAKEIPETTRYWDWELDRDRIPRCVDRLRSLLENICVSLPCREAYRSISGGEANA